MIFRDFDKYYQEVFPKPVTPTTSKVETPVGAKDISEEHKEVFVDETWVDKTPTKEEPEPIVKEEVEDGNTGFNQGTGE